MRIVCLMENTIGNETCKSEHGLSLYIELEDMALLADAGASELFLENARKLNVDLTKVETLFLSHGHYDHGGGILAFHKIYNKNSSFITTIEALMQYAPKQVDFITLKKGETYSISSLIENFVKLGYKRVDYIQGFGEFSVRGDIFDIYPFFFPPTF